MKINVLKTHHHYRKGENNVPEDRGNYLISIGVAEKMEDVVKEKAEHVKEKEKVENKPGNVPTARGRKKR